MQASTVERAMSGMGFRETQTRKMKTAVTAAIRLATRAYIQNAPWTAGKSAAYKVFNDYVGWRPHRATVRTRYGDLMDLSMPDVVSSAIYVTGRWEPVITQYIRSNLNSGDTFVDVGANIGYYSLVASRIVGSAGHVFAIEASKSLYARMMQNLALNGCTNVRAIHAAASSEKGELSIFLGGGGNLGHTTTVESLAKKQGLVFEDKAPADTLEQLVGTQSLRNARFIKLDVEGAECSVLAPLFDSLGQFSPRTEWLVELSPEYSPGGQEDVDRIYQAFIAAGYTSYAIRNEYRVEFFLSPSDKPVLKRLDAAPREICDVLMTRFPQHRNDG
jgi:FkbM family methyltransferase